MTREELYEIIEQEHLKHAVFDEAKPYTQDLCLCQRNGKWVIYATDERAAVVTGSEKQYDNEEEANEHFLRRLRAGNRLSR